MSLRMKEKDNDLDLYEAFEFMQFYYSMRDCFNVYFFWLKEYKIT